MSSHALADVDGFKKRGNMFFVDPAAIKVVDGWNDRTDFSEEDELVESIKQVGVLQPLKVRKNVDKEMELIDGERRLRAVLRARREGADIQTVKVIALPQKTSEIDLYLESVIANTSKPLIPVDEANSFKRLMSWGLTVREIASKAGRSETHVRNRLELADAVPAIKDAVAKGEITANDAVKIVKKSGGKVAPQTEALDKKKSAPKKTRVRALHLSLEEGEVKTKGKKGASCDPLADVLKDEALRQRILAAGYDPDSLKMSVSKIDPSKGA